MDDKMVEKYAKLCADLDKSNKLIRQQRTEIENLKKELNELKGFNSNTIRGK